MDAQKAEENGATSTASGDGGSLLLNDEAPFFLLPSGRTSRAALAEFVQRSLPAAAAIHVGILALVLLAPHRPELALNPGHAVAVTVVAQGPPASSPAPSAVASPTSFADLFANAAITPPILERADAPTTSLSDLLHSSSPPPNPAASRSAAASSANGTGDVDRSARTATVFADNTPVDLRTRIDQCWKKPFGAKPVRLRFALTRDGAVSELGIIETVLDSAPESTKAAAERAVRDCAPYPAQGAVRSFVLELN